MKHKIIFLKRWLFGCLLFFICGCIHDSTSSNVSRQDLIAQDKRISAALLAINKSKNQVVSGDLIMRTGKDYTSKLMSGLSEKDKTFSHAGIASWENDTLFVYHAIGGEWNPDEKLRRDQFQFFCNPFENRGFGIYRYLISAKQKEKIILLAKKFYGEQITFDMNFDLATDAKMYCTEFVYKTIKRATNDSLKIPTTTVDKINFVAADNLFLNPFCYQIKRVSFAAD